jgi:hypothetical protein
MPAHRVTLKDIAQADRPLRGHDLPRPGDHPDISGETKQRVRDAAQAMSYIPNYRARYLRAKHSRLIALIVPEMNMFFVPSMIAGINHVVQQNDYSLIVFQSDNSIVQERRLAEYTTHLSADGVLVVLSSETADLQHLDVLHEFGIPVVLLDRTIETTKYTTITIDDEQAGAKRRRTSWTAATRASSACSATSGSASAACGSRASVAPTPSVACRSPSRRSSPSRWSATSTHSSHARSPRTPISRRSSR